MSLPSFPYRAGPVVWLGIVGVTCLILFVFQKILWLVVPFVLALIIYYLLLPWKLRLVLRGMTHDQATAVISIGACVGLVGVGYFLFPILLGEMLLWQATSLRYFEGGVVLAQQILLQLEGRFSMLAEAQVSAELTRQLADFSDHFAGRYLPSIAMTMAAWAPSLLLAPFLAFFMLRDGWRFKKFLGRAVPNAFFERSLFLLDQVDRTARLYFVGLIQLTLLDTVCLALGLWLIGVSAPLVLGFLTAILAWVPYIGSILGCLMVVLVAATDFPGQTDVAYAAVGLFIVVRLLDDFLFMPLTIGKSLNMHPLLTVLMIFVGGAVAGVPGLMLVLPVLGVVMVFGETIGQVVSDPRLQARFAHEKSLKNEIVTKDLSRMNYFRGE